MENKEIKKLFEFILNDGENNRHFEITGKVKVVHNIVGYPFLETEEILVYETKGDKKVSFEPTATRWATGERLKTSDVFDDVLERYIRNETEDFKVLYVDPEVSCMAAVYKNRTALIYKGRNIPYQIIDNDMQYVYQLCLATSEYLYYCSDEAMVMLSTKDGALVSDNYFAEIGYSDSEDAIEEGMEENLVFKKYMHPKKAYEIGLKFDLWKLY